MRTTHNKASSKAAKRAERNAARERDEKAQEKAARKEEQKALHDNMFDDPVALNKVVPLVPLGVAHGDASKSKSTFERLVTVANLVPDVEALFPHVLLGLATELVHVWAAEAKAAEGKAAADKAVASTHAEALALARSTPEPLQNFLLNGWGGTRLANGQLRAQLRDALTAQDEASWLVDSFDKHTAKLHAMVCRAEEEGNEEAKVEAETDLAWHTEDTEAKKKDCLAVLAKSGPTIWAVGVLWVGLLAMEVKPEPEVASPKAQPKKPRKRRGGGDGGGANKK